MFLKPESEVITFSEGLLDWTVIENLIKKGDHGQKHFGFFGQMTNGSHLNAAGGYAKFWSICKFWIIDDEA